MRKRFVLATLLSLIISTTTLGHVSEPILPLTQDKFTAIELPPRPTPIPLIKEPIDVPLAPTSRPKVEVVEPEPKLVLKSTPKPQVTVSGRSISGLASYLCSPAHPTCTRGYPIGSYVAAVGPQLRVALGGGYDSNAPQPWKNKVVTVCGSKGCADVKLVDWCQCYWKQSHEKLIDLYHAVFVDIGADKGRVTVSW